MLKETTAASEKTKLSVTFAELVEHPGGHDGGEFVQEHEYSVNSNGTLNYNSSVVTDQHNVFGDVDTESLLEVTDVTQARSLLRSRLEALEADLVNLRALVQAAEKEEPTPTLWLYWNDEPAELSDDEDPDGDGFDEDDDSQEDDEQD